MRRRRKQNKKLIIGLTGSIGTGKSTVAKIFANYGAKVIDADKIAHDLLRPGSVLSRRVIRAFGREITDGKEGIDRRKLGYLVFSNKSKLKKLNSITHPSIIRAIKSRIKSFKSGIIILDAPLLVEAGLKKIVGKIIVVKASRKKQLLRAAKAHHLSKKDALMRVKMQMPLQAKVRIADFLIDNDGTLIQTRKQVAELRRLLWRS